MGQATASSLHHRAHTEPCLQAQHVPGRVTYVLLQPSLMSASCCAVPAQATRRPAGFLFALLALAFPLYYCPPASFISVCCPPNLYP